MYDDARDILIRRDDTDWELWRVTSSVAVRSPLQSWRAALENARAQAERTGGGVYRQVGSAKPERVEPTGW